MQRIGDLSLSRGTPAALVALLVGAAAVRVALLDVPGHGGDVRVMAGWAERMAAVGPWQFYDGGGSIYPALLYPLWALGALLDGEGLSLAIKGLSIPFDLVLGGVLFAVGRALSSERTGITMAALYLLNPAVLLAGPVWGQVDAAGTLCFMAALIASSTGRDGRAAALAMVAGLVKPQFGLVALPVLAVAGLRSRRERRWRPIGVAFAGAVLAYAVVAAPLALHPPRYLGLLAGTATYQPFTSLHAFNPWGLVVGFNLPDAPYVGLGAALLLVGLAGALTGLRRGTDLLTLLAVGAVVAIAFYMLPTRVHERYLFPALALLAPFAALGTAQLIAYVTFSLAYAASLVHALHATTPFNVPEPMATVLVSDLAVWIIGLVLIGSAIAWCWLLLVRDPRLEAADRRRSA